MPIRPVTLEMLPPPPADKIGWPWTEAAPSRDSGSLDPALLPTLSIVTPSYNQGDYLEETIRSVLLQGYPKLQYYVMDGGSHDGSKAIIEKYAAWLDGWVSEPDAGQSDAINKGFARCSGDLGNWLNSDDVLTPGALWTVVNARDLQAVDEVLVGHGLIVDLEGDLVFEPRRDVELNAESLLDWIARSNFMQPSCFFPLAKARQHGFVNSALRYCMDVDLWLKLARDCRFRRLPDCLSHSKAHSLAKTFSQRHAMHAELLTLIAGYGGIEILERELKVWAKRLAVADTELTNRDSQTSPESVTAGKLKVLALVHVPVNPSYPNGFSPRIHGFMRALGERTQLELLLIRGIWFKGAIETMAPDASVRMHGLHHDTVLEQWAVEPPPRRWWSRAADLIQHFTSHQPLASPWLPSEKLLALVRQHQPDLVIFHLHHLAHFAFTLPSSVRCLFVLEEGDERHELYMATAHNTDSSNVLMRAWRHFYWSKRLVHYREFYRQLGSRGPVVAINEHEKSWFGRAMPLSNISVIPYGVDCVELAPQAAVEDYHIGIFGALEQVRNYQPALELFREISKRSSTRLKWLFVGTRPDASILALADDYVTVTGEVSDVRPFYGRAQLIIIPMLHGAGTKSTLLKAWAMQRPVLTTPLALRGTPAKPGQNVAVAKDVPALAQEALRLLAKPAERAALAAAGRHTALKECNLERFSEQFADLCINLMESSLEERLASTSSVSTVRNVDRVQG